MADLKSRVALVTGASRGVGRGIAEGLAEAGATVYATGRTSSIGMPPEASSVEATAALVDDLGGRGVAVPVDHRDDAAVAAVFAQIAAREGRLDLLVNNACGLPEPPLEPAKFWQQPVARWDEQCGAGLRGAYVAAVHAARLMVEGGGGLIVNVSSKAALDSRYGTAYGVCKAGLERMARDMAQELSGTGVHALAIRPMIVRTESVLDAVARGSLSLNLQTSCSPRFVGRCVAALAMDPDIVEKSGGSFDVADLEREYRFTDPEGRQRRAG